MTSTSGLSTMSPAITEARRYHRWLLKKATPYLGACVLEIGTGYGDYTQLLVGDRELVVGIDIAQDCVDHCQKIFRNNSKVVCKRFDIEKDNLRILQEYHLDSAVCFNVLEHVEDDVYFLKRIKDALAPGARLVLIIPAHQFLYGTMDRLAGHFRRYSRSAVNTVAEKSGWRVHSSRYFNAVGAVGWLVTGKILKPNTLAEPRLNSQIIWFDRFFLPFAKLVDPVTKFFFGQSLIVVLERD